jgi:hypothetical protein
VSVLSTRELNRALLARQGLLERERAAPLEMAERLVGLQAQVPENPYVALWSRIESFRPEELSDAIAERRAARSHLMRATIHLASARDTLALQPLTLPVRERTFRSPWSPGLAGADLDEVVATGRELLAAEPRTRAELSDLLAPRWPDADPLALAYAVSYHCALVQLPPRGLWGGSGQPRWALVEDWLGAPLNPSASLEQLVLRYLGAFGPATVADIRTWSGLTGLREVVKRLRPELRAFSDERGRELLDLPDAPLPAPATPAPPRFLPEYDNVSLSHEDRSRILAPAWPGWLTPGPRWIGALLVDGFYRAHWRISEDGVLRIEHFGELPGDPRGTRDQIVAEGERLLELVVPDAPDPRVAFGGET